MDEILSMKELLLGPRLGRGNRIGKDKRERVTCNFKYNFNVVVSKTAH